MRNIALALAASLSASPVAAQEKPATKPNVLFIVADDFRDEGGVFTHAKVKLPNLARLAAHGVRFERAYVQYPVCNPSRSSLLTGLRPEQTKIVNNTTRLRSQLPEVLTLPQYFKNNGWHAEAFGKLYHLSGATEAERALWMDLPQSWHAATAFSPTKLGQRNEGRNLTDGTLPWCQWGMAEGGDDDQPDGQTAAAVVKLIEKQGASATPWFIGCGFLKPHDPFIAPKKYFDLYPPGSLTLWKDPADRTAAPPLALAGGYQQAFDKFTDKERLEFLRAYCASASYMDAQLGRVLDALDKGKLWDKTIVVFIGDHGYHTGERQWWNKNTLFERSCRAPLIITAPGIKGGKTSRSLVEFIDLFPTLAESCGLKVPTGLAGRSLRPVLSDPKRTLKDAAFTLVTRGQSRYGQSVRTEHWRFTQWSDGTQELYDHRRDPEESQSVVAQNPKVVAELLAKLKALPPYP
jgi:iduronate 2-sulfatase